MKKGRMRRAETSTGPAWSRSSRSDLAASSFERLAASLKAKLCRGMGGGFCVRTQSYAALIIQHSPSV